MQVSRAPPQRANDWLYFYYAPSNQLMMHDPRSNYFYQFIIVEAFQRLQFVPKSFFAHARPEKSYGMTQPYFCEENGRVAALVTNDFTWDSLLIYPLESADSSVYKGRLTFNIQ